MCEKLRMRILVRRILVRKRLIRTDNNFIIVDVVGFNNQILRAHT